MKIKNIVTVFLLLFIIASVVFLVYRESREDADEPSAEEQVTNGNARKMETPDGVRTSDESRHVVIAYYFHTTERCMTCRKIEAYTAESIKTKFARQLETGRLRFNVVNVDEAANGHFIDDYRLTSKSVVLADYRDGEQVRWKNLDRIWQYVQDKETFMEYVEGETQNFLGELQYE